MLYMQKIHRGIMLAQDLKFYQVEWKSASEKILRVVVEESKLAHYVELFLIKGITVSILPNFNNN